jgi:hypothetical protein
MKRLLALLPLLVVLVISCKQTTPTDNKEDSVSTKKEAIACPTGSSKLEISKGLRRTKNIRQQFLNTI